MSKLKIRIAYWHGQFIGQVVDQQGRFFNFNPPHLDWTSSWDVTIRSRAYPGVAEICYGVDPAVLLFNVRGAVESMDGAVFTIPLRWLCRLVKAVLEFNGMTHDDETVCEIIGPLTVGQEIIIG